MLFITLVLVVLLQSSDVYGLRDVPFFDETPLCSDGFMDRKEMPVYEFERPPLSLDRMLDVAFSPDMPAPLPFLRMFSGSNDMDAHAQYTMGNRDSPFRTLKKRSIGESESSPRDEAQYEVRFLTPLLRETREKEDVKTIHLPQSFTPRLGRKRSQEAGYTKEESSYNTDLKVDGRSNKKNKINLFAGNAFTPRLGRSEDAQRIRFQAGSAFTPRLGRSSNLDRVVFNSRAAFNPRQQRSNRINLNAGSAFTPRLGRSSDDNKMVFNAGSSFTPRLGRSEDRSRIQLNAGSAFTPRLG